MSSPLTARSGSNKERGLDPDAGFPLGNFWLIRAGGDRFAAFPWVLAVGNLFDLAYNTNRW